MVSRRNALRVLGAGLTGLAGCASWNGGETPVDSTASPPAETPTASTPTATTSSSTSTTAEPQPSVDVEGAEATWTRNFDGPVYDPPVYADSHVVVAVGETLYGLDADTGETAWTLDPPPDTDGDPDRLDARFAVHEGTVYALLGVDRILGGSEYTLLALQPDGTEKWRYASEYLGFHVPLGSGDGALVVSTRDDGIDVHGQEVFVVDLDTGRERWSAASGDMIGGAVGNDVAANLAGYLALDCFDLASGERTFRFEPGEDRVVEAVAVGGDHVFAGVGARGTDVPTLRALDPANGEPLWTWSEARVGSLRYLDDLYVGGGSIFRLGPDGTERWRYDGGGTVHGRPWRALGGIPFDDDALYTNSGNRLVSVRRDDGRERWSVPGWGDAIPAERVGNLVLVRDGDGVNGVEATDGQARWGATAPEFFHEPATGDEAAFLVSKEGTVLRIPA